MGAEAGDLDIVVEQVGILGNAIVLAGKEFFLEIEARSPGEIAADFEVLTLAVAIHVGRHDAFGGLRIMGAAGGMNVMVAGPPAKFRWINPTLQFERGALVLVFNNKLLMPDQVFRPASELDIVWA